MLPTWCLLPLREAGLFEGWQDSAADGNQPGNAAEHARTLEAVAKNLNHVSLLQGTRLTAYTSDPPIPAASARPRHQARKLIFSAGRLSARASGGQEWYWTGLASAAGCRRGDRRQSNVLPPLASMPALRREAGFRFLSRVAIPSCSRWSITDLLAGAFEWAADASTARMRSSYHQWRCLRLAGTLASDSGCLWDERRSSLSRFPLAKELPKPRDRIGPRSSANNDLTAPADLKTFIGESIAIMI